MVFAVPPKNKNKILNLFKKENVEATFIGKFTNDGKLLLKYGKEIVADMEMSFLHGGVPKPTRKAVWKQKQIKKKVKNRNMRKMKKLIVNMILNLK